MQIDKTIPLSSTHAWRHQRRPRAAIWHERNKCIFSLDELDSFKIVYKGLNLTLRVKALLLYFHCVTASRTDDVRCNKRLWTRVIAADEMCESCWWTSSVSSRIKQPWTVQSLSLLIRLACNALKLNALYLENRTATCHVKTLRVIFEKPNKITTNAWMNE